MWKCKNQSKPKQTFVVCAHAQIGFEGMSSEVVSSRNRRPRNTQFQQQRFRVWQSFMNIHTAIPLFGTFGFVFSVVFCVIILVNQNVYEYRYDYTKCPKSISGDPQGVDKCKIVFSLEKKLDPPIYLYYILENYHQNFRLYSDSIDYSQFMGSPSEHPSERCAPLRYDKGNKPYIPCGLLANSLFNDTFVLKKGNNVIPWSYDDLILPNERHFFKNPDNIKDLKNNFSHPPDWPKHIDELGDGSTKVGFENYDLINWIRVSPFPDAVKLHRKISLALEAGEYTLEIENFYPVDGVHVKKYFMIATTGYLGLRSNFLGYIYLVVGIICIISSLFLFIHRRYKGDSY